MDFYKTSWFQSDLLRQTPLWKRAIYFLARPLLSYWGRLHLHPKTLARWKPEYVFISRGMSHETRKKWALQSLDISQANILIQGTGTGGDILSWVRLKPKKIIGVDLFSFEDSWLEISNYCKEHYDVEVEFHQASLENLSFIKDASIDICSSENVFEHCKNLPDVMKECRRVIKPDGIVFASYAPLWYAPGGDHFSSRGGLPNIYNHLLLDEKEYKDFFQKNLQSAENFQDGGRYVEMDLFSKFSTQQYLDIYNQAGFRIDGLNFQIDRQALAFRTQYPQKFSKLTAKYRDICGEDDFLIGTHIIRLRKLNS